MAQPVQLDLNLLIALDALLSEGSVTRAAERLHLSVPATSRTLSRIRVAFGDPILVRAGRHMVPTARAHAIQAEVHRLVQDARALVTDTAVDMRSVRRTFTVLANDSQVSFLGRVLLDRCRVEAPGVQVRFVAEGAGDNPSLRESEVDIEVNVIDDHPPDIHLEPFFSDRLIGVARPGHPLLRGQVTPRRFARAAHVTSSRRGRLAGPIDQLLAQDGLTRSVVASAPTSSAALLMIAGGDLVGMVAERLCRPVVDAIGLRYFQLPYQLPTIDISCAWHRRHDTDQTHRWLRQTILDAATQAA